MRSAKSNKFFERYKKEQVVKFLSKLFVTSAVVVGAVVIIDRVEPTISFTSVEVIGQEVYYETSISDPGETLTVDSLKLDIKGGLEAFSVPLKTGVSRGNFPIRYEDTLYNLRIMGSQGFGLKTFASHEVLAKSEPTAIFLNIDYTSSDNNAYVFTVDVLTNNPDNKLTNLRLSYTYEYGGIGQDNPGSGSEPQPAIVVPFTTAQQTFTLDPIYRGVTKIHLAVLADDQSSVHTLKAKTVDMPTIIQLSPYIREFSTNYLVVDTHLMANILYDWHGKVSLFKDDILVEEKDFVLPTFDPQGPPQNTMYRFDNLVMASLYSVKITIEYFDLFHLERRTFETAPVSAYTSPSYSQNTNVTKMDNPPSISIAISYLDESNIIAGAFVYVYQQNSDGTKTYLDFLQLTSRDNPDLPPWKIFEGTYDYSQNTANYFEIYLSKSYQNQYDQELIYTYTL